VILLTKLNGPEFALNADLIERAESTPDTVLTMVDGTRYVVRESVTEIIDQIRTFRASIVALSTRIEVDVPPSPVLRVVPSETE